ncbi:MAG: hypothetical protein ABUT20_13320, partial [Bacteroidota bacterium]
MRKRLPGKILGLYYLLFCNVVFAQTKSADSSILNASLQNVINFHNESLGAEIHLYNGPQNAGYNHLSIGNPYFLADAVQVGAVLYDGILYKSVPMLYDLVQDNAVILQYSDKDYSKEYRDILRMDLIRNRLAWFSLAGHEFVRLEPDSNSIKMPDGFYDKVYGGKINLFVKRIKKYVEEVK